ncbi:MAG: hypothetical protein A4E65_00527 [Syntrophorhabdus sp. PtaU1.Bin153]|nr:MAG: hypothetical protein A4E65_00527 [Syntrophorhabdus sp. PtaU1.Bin153]
MACSFPSRILLFCLAAATFFLNGCGGNSSGARFYTLTSLGFPEGAGQAAADDQTVIVRIGPVQIPDYLDRPQIVTRTAANELSLGDFDLWGGSLGTDVERVLVENLSVLLAKDRISVAGWKSRYSTMGSVPVWLDRLDVVPGDKIILKARWGIIGNDGRALEPPRDVTLSRPVNGSGYGDVVAAMSDALVSLSRDIAAGIKATVTKRDAGRESRVAPGNG